MVHKMNLKKLYIMMYSMITAVLLSITLYGVYETTQLFRGTYADFRNQYTMNANVREWIILVEMSDTMSSIVSNSFESIIDISYYEKNFDSVTAQIENLQSNIGAQTQDAVSEKLFSELKTLHELWKQELATQVKYQSIPADKVDIEAIALSIRSLKTTSRQYTKVLREYESQVEYQHVFKTQQTMAKMHLALISVGLLGLMVLMLSATYINKHLAPHS